MTEAKEMSLNRFARSLGFSLTGAKNWLLIPEFRNFVRIVHKGKSVRYFITDPEKAKEALKRAGYVIPEEGEDA